LRLGDFEEDDDLLRLLLITLLEFDDEDADRLEDLFFPSCIFLCSFRSFSSCAYKFSPSPSLESEELEEDLARFL